MAPIPTPGPGPEPGPEPVPASDPASEALGLAPAEASVKGVYKLLEANGTPDVTLVYQGSDVAYAFIDGVLPHLVEKGINADVYYISSVELFDRLPAEEREAIFPASAAACT